MSGEVQNWAEQVRRLYVDRDPVPAGLVDRIMPAILLQDLLGDLDFETLRRAAPLDVAGARDAGDAVTHVTLESPRLSVTLHIAQLASAGRLDGYLGDPVAEVPVSGLRIELHTPAGARETRADQDGRFVFTDVPHGLLQLVVHPTDDASLHLPRAVAAPGFQL